MEPKTDRPPLEKQPEAPTAPRKRFRIEKVEERIAPGGHYNPHSKWVGDGNGGGESSASGSFVGSIY